MDYFSVTSTILLSVATIFCYLLFMRYKRFRYFEDLGIPGPKPHFWTGNAYDIQFGTMKPITSFQKWKDMYGKVFGYYIGTLPSVVICDVDLLKQIAIKDFGSFPDRWQLPSLFPAGDKSLVGLSGQRWKDVRKILTPAFSANKLRHITPVMKTAILDFDSAVKKIEANDKEFDIYDRFQRLTLDVIGQSALAMKVNCQEEEHCRLYEQVKEIMRMAALSKLFVFVTSFPELLYPLKYVIHLHPEIKTTMNIISNLGKVLKLRRSQQEQSMKTVDMLQLMLNASAEVKTSVDQSATTDELLKDEEILGNCFIFLLAGFDTTATTLAYVAYMLSTYSDVQEKVYQEMRSEVKDLSNVTYDDANNLYYLDQVISETMRIYPPVWSVNRMCTEEYEIMPGKKLSKGTKIDIPIHAIHHDPELWPEPEKFDPERFSPENKGKIHPAAHIPFGIGPRACIGMRFALLEIKFTLISLLTKYSLHPPTEAKLPPELFVAMGTYVPKNGLFVIVKPRPL